MYQQSMKTTKLRFWVELFAMVSAVACAVALLIATLGTAAAGAQGGASQPAQSSSSPQRTYEGMITDTRCGAKHSAALGRTAADCTRACVHAGEQFSLVDGDMVYALKGDLMALKQAAGQRVRIVGTRNGATILVTAVARNAS